MSELYVRNRQRTQPLNLKLFQEIASNLVGRICRGEYRIGVVLVGDREMQRLNEAFLQHAGPTDVLAFGYTNKQKPELHGEVFICVDEAMRQARRFRTTWQKEVVRYLAHGLLHFRGHRDGTPKQRRRMKLIENALVQELAREFCLSQLLRKPKLRS